MDIDTDISVYSSEVKNFVQWCDKHHLIFNVKKAEEIIFDPGQPGDTLYYGSIMLESLRFILTNWGYILTLICPGKSI